MAATVPGMTTFDFTQLAWISALVGAAIPFVAALLKQNHFSHSVNSAIALVVSAVAGFLTAAASGELNGVGLFTAIGIVAGAGKVLYDGPLKTAARKVEAATSKAVPSEEEKAAAERAKKEARLAELDAQDEALEAEREQLKLELEAHPAPDAADAVIPGTLPENA